MRGASALENVLRDIPEVPLRVLVVWEPVLWTDLGPPTTRVLARLSDRRVIQFWDDAHLVSGEFLRSERARHGNGAAQRADRVPQSKGVAWDLIALYPPGARWDGELPLPAFADGPVVAAIEAARKHLASVKAPPGPLDPP